MLVSFEEPLKKPILLNLPVKNNVKNSPRRNIFNCWLEYPVQNLRAYSQSTHTKFHTYFYKKSVSVILWLLVFMWHVRKSEERDH